MFEQNNFLVNYKGKSYEISAFLRDHPGGIKILKNSKGKNIDLNMSKYDHSIGAYRLLNDFKLNNYCELNKDIMDDNVTGVISNNGRIITKDELSNNEDEINYLEELEGRIDWSKPILEQLSKVQCEYNTWVNSVVYKHARLFNNDYLEYLTLTPWYIVPIYWTPIILFMLIYSYSNYVGTGVEIEMGESKLTLNKYILNLLFGIFIWTLLEYALHRWVFHLNPGKSLAMIKFHFLIHGLHHKVPFDCNRQVFPPIPATVIVLLLYIPFNILLPYPIVSLVGGLIGYLTYDMIHYYIHHGSPKYGTYMYNIKRYHSNHHFINHDKAFGITNKMWDHVFSTIVNVKKLSVKLCWRDGTST